MRVGWSHRGDEIRIQHHPDLAAQEVEENGDTLAIRHAFEQAETGRKRAVDDADGIARREPRGAIELDEATLVLARPQRSDHVATDGRRQSPLHTKREMPTVDWIARQRCAAASAAMNR